MVLVKMRNLISSGLVISSVKVTRQLIPESLPVLAELLEDSDEDVAGLAQECITQSEDLLGESLQDNLR